MCGVKETMIPTPEEFKKGCLAYEKNEQRDSMYKVSTFLLQHHWGQPEDMADALGVLLSTWNNAFYRYGPFSYDELQQCIEGNLSILETYRSKSIINYTEDDDKNIKVLFMAFLAALKIATGNNKGRQSPVGTAKALHLLGPKFFPIWDDKIAKHYKCLYSIDPAGQYISFCHIARDMAKELSPHAHRPDRSILKLIDEFNYARYTKKWI